MIHKIFIIYDHAAEAYLLPFILPTKGLAIRGFTNAANEPTHDFCKYPADYTLFEAGTFDDSDATFDLTKALCNLGTALEHQSPQDAPEALEAVAITG